MRKKTMAPVLIAVAIAVALVCIAGVIIKSPGPPFVTPIPSFVTQPPRTPPPITQPPKFENVEIKLNESASVKGNLIKLISIEEEKGIVKIEVHNETTGEPMIVPLSLQDYVAFKYKNIAIFLSKIEDNKVTLLIGEAAYYEEDMRTQ
ncbi:MAG: hypothetical protein EFT35_03255 [Methanophagales archaeon ANME-1-THS]|nr:MAG: hypothetical protein EFT35_03255 [Methanophagales archaeon ANME-1-THS]